MDNLKICTVCNVSKEKSDYINNNDECYKCVYARKIAELKESGISLGKSKSCKMCRNKLPNQRWTYCSIDCAKEAKRRHRHWTLSCKGDTKDWKKRFIF